MKTDTHKAMACEDGGRDRSDVSISQEVSRTAGRHWKLGEKGGIDTSSEPSERTSPAYTWISDL